MQVGLVHHGGADSLALAYGTRQNRSSTRRLLRLRSVYSDGSLTWFRVQGQQRSMSEAEIAWAVGAEFARNNAENPPRGVIDVTRRKRGHICQGFCCRKGVN